MKLMASKVLKRSVVIRGHKTSISIEDEFWGGLRRIAETRGLTISALLKEIDEGRDCGNLSSAIRVHVLKYYRDKGVTASPTPQLDARLDNNFRQH